MGKIIKERVSWVLMAVIAITIIVMGFEGSLGKVIGCLLTPAEVEINT